MPASNDEKRIVSRNLTKRFDERLRLARASELAAYGHLLAAETLLCPGSHLPTVAEELDLLARIHVHQGRFNEARRRWHDAVKTGVRADEYEECIKVLDDWLDYRQRLMKWRLVVGFCFTAVLIASWMLTRFYLATPK